METDQPKPTGEPDCIFCGRPPHPDSYGHSYRPMKPKPAETGLRDYHDVPFPEGTQPTTGEWTEGRVFAYFESEDFKGAADAHNAALNAAIEQKRLEIWADAPNQPDIQEAVIAKLDLVHRDAIAAATKPLVDALKDIATPDKFGEYDAVSMAAVAKATLAKVKEGK